MVRVNLLKKELEARALAISKPIPTCKGTSAAAKTIVFLSAFQKRSSFRAFKKLLIPANPISEKKISIFVKAITMELQRGITAKTNKIIKEGRRKT
jgi:hypothetical protein